MSKDTIYRQDFDKYLEDAEKESVKNRKYVFASALNAVRGNLRNFPSAEPEIIRCKDCVNWDTTWQNDYAPNYHYCPFIDGTRRDDFYCADAERRTDE